MKKRIVSALLAAFLCVGLLAACGSKDNKNEETTTTAQTTAVETTEATTAKAAGQEITAVKGVTFSVSEGWKNINSPTAATAGFTFGQDGNVLVNYSELTPSSKQTVETLVKLYKTPGMSKKTDAGGGEIVNANGVEGVSTVTVTKENILGSIYFIKDQKVFTVVITGKPEQKDDIEKGMQTIISSLKFA